MVDGGKKRLQIIYYNWDTHTGSKLFCERMSRASFKDIRQRAMGMAIRVRYFASLRDQLGRGEDLFTAGENCTVSQVWARLWPDVPLPPNTLAAVNMEYSDLDQPVRDGDEVAFFPPVTGG